MTLCLIGPCLSTGDWLRSIPAAERNAFHHTATLPRPSQHARPITCPQNKDPRAFFLDSYAASGKSAAVGNHAGTTLFFVTVHELRSS